jgi:hypothetical protein
VTLAQLVSVVSRRWRIEELFQGMKATVGLDQGQVTRWTSWHRWSCAALTAYAYLAITTAQAAAQDSGDADLVPLTCRELLRLLRQLLLPAPRRDAAHVQHWSRWRRRHQHRAREAHHRWHAYADTIPQPA